MEVTAYNPATKKFTGNRIELDGITKEVAGFAVTQAEKKEQEISTTERRIEDLTRSIRSEKQRIRQQQQQLKKFKSDNDLHIIQKKLAKQIKESDHISSGNIADIRLVDNDIFVTTSKLYFYPGTKLRHKAQPLSKKTEIGTFLIRIRLKDYLSARISIESAVEAMNLDWIVKRDGSGSWYSHPVISKTSICLGDIYSPLKDLFREVEIVPAIDLLVDIILSTKESNGPYLLWTDWLRDRERLCKKLEPGQPYGKWKDGKEIGKYIPKKIGKRFFLETRMRQLHDNYKEFNLDEVEEAIKFELKNKLVDITSYKDAIRNLNRATIKHLKDLKGKKSVKKAKKKVVKSKVSKPKPEDSPVARIPF